MKRNFEKYEVFDCMFCDGKGYRFGIFGIAFKCPICKGTGECKLKTASTKWKR